MKVVVAPPVPALLPRYASLTDPVPQLRAACAAAVEWLGPAQVVADSPLACEVGEALLGARLDLSVDPGYLVMANGSARRSERAPGHLDERAFDFDSRIEAALAAGDTTALGRLALHLGEELLAEGMHALGRLASLRVIRAEMDYADDPFGVRYWVVRWECAS